MRVCKRPVIISRHFLYALVIKMATVRRHGATCALQYMHRFRMTGNALRIEAHDTGLQCPPKADTNTYMISFADHNEVQAGKLYIRT